MSTVQLAFPRIFKRAYPALDPSTPMLPAISLLRFHEIDALPITVMDSERGRRAIYGYSSLARLLRMRPENFGRFLNEPCESASESLATVNATDRLRKLFKTFERTRFGFAWVETRDSPGGLVTLNDLLELYETGVIRTDLRVGDVASQMFSMPATTSLRDALSAMFSRRYRRVFLSGEGDRAFISDRTIIERIFSPAMLQSFTKESEDILQIPIADVSRLQPKIVSSKVTISAGAGELRGQTGRCLVCEKGVVTSWDLLMKPWISKALQMVE